MSPARTRSSRLRRLACHCAVLLTYAIVAAGLFGEVWPSPQGRYAGSIPDALQQVWFLSWTAHALTAHQSLLFTHALNAPSGVNLLWNTAMILPGILAAPITLTAGPVVAYNVLITAALALSAWSGYAVILSIAHRRLASWLGGLLFGFSPYMLAQALGHLDLVIMAYVPLALWFFVEAVCRQRCSWRWVGLAFGAGSAAQFFVFQELLVGAAIAFVIGTVVTAVLWRDQVALRWRHATQALLTAGIVFAVAAGWAVFYQFTGPQTPPGLEVAHATGTDLLAFVTPTVNQAIAPAGAQSFSASFVAQTTGADGYVGVPLLLLLGVIVWRFRHRRDVLALAITAASLAVLSLGPVLTVGGHETPVPLPWALLQHLPVVGNLVPLRLMGYASLPIAALLAIALAELPRLSGRGRALIALLTAATVASWAPSLPRPATAVPEPPALPAGIVNGLPSRAVVLFAPLPSYATADAMFYQAQAGERFDLVGGYAYDVPPDVPLMSLLQAPSDAGVEAALRSLASDVVRRRIIDRYRSLRITTVLVPPGRFQAGFTALFTTLFQSPPATAGSFATWDLRADIAGA